MAKNKMRRCLAAILDPHPSQEEVAQLWTYFDSSCAYCGARIERASRTGHMDHVESSALGGSNSIFNHVLACARCNGDEKREESWQTFLAKKAGDQAPQRQARIEAWLARVAGAAALDPQTRAQASAIIDNVIGNFDAAVRQLRALRGGST